MHRLLLLLSMSAFVVPEAAFAAAPVAMKAKRSSTGKTAKKKAKKKNGKGEKKKARKKRASDRRPTARPKPKPQTRRARKKPRTRRAREKPPRRPTATRRARSRPHAQPRRAARRVERRRAPPPPPSSPPPESDVSAADSDVVVWLDTRSRIVETVRERSSASGTPRVSSDAGPHGRDGSYGSGSGAAPLPAPTGPDKNRPEPGEGVTRPTADVDPEATTADLAAQEAPPARDRFLRSVGVDGSYANWVLQPLASERQTAARSELTTVERYDVAPIHLYRAALTLETRYATVGFAYETDRGFSAGHDASTLFDVLVQLTGVPGLDRFSFVYRDLDFRYGEVDLVDRASGDVIQHEAFSVMARTGELRFRANAGVYVFGRYLGYALPRTLYLEEDGAGGTLYHQVSSGLLEVDADVWMLGVGWKRPPSRSPWQVALHVGGGAGPYDINGLSTGERFDGGHLVALSAGGLLGYRWPVNEWLAVGARDELTMVALDPVGLPDGIERELRDDGVDTERFSIDLGAVELLNHFTVYAELRL